MSDPDPRAPHPVITWARRTPIGTAGHAFAELTAADLAAPLLAAAARHLDGSGGRVDDVVLGNCLGPGGNIARVAALAAGLDTATPAVTVDRQCGSGLDAVLQAAARVRAGEATGVLAGGVESASTAPWRFWPPRPGRDPVRYRRAPFAPPGVPDPEMGPAADALAARLGISRLRQDEYALRSHTRAATAVRAGTFHGEIVPVAGRAMDERTRPGMTLDRLGRLPPSFGAGGTATAGNSCGISDGAAVLAVERGGAADGLRIVSAVAAGCDPALPGLGAAAAIRKLLGRQAVRELGITLADIGVVELTEAFASVALATIDDLGIGEDIVCPDGGAIALGHPWGASGAVLLVRLAARMLSPQGPEFGVAACPVGGGQGVAMLVRRSCGVSG